MSTNPQRVAARQRIMRLFGVLSIISSLVLGLSATAASAADENGFAQEPNKNTYVDETSLSAQCPEGIAGTPGSDPARKQLVGNTIADFGPNGTVHYVYKDNPNDDSENFNLEDCVVAYPPATFQASDFDPNTGVLTNALKKNELTKNATELDKATLTDIGSSKGDIYFSWSPAAAGVTLTPGQWVCNYARDTATGHGGGGNRKVSPTCYQVKAAVTPAAVTNTVGDTCDELDTYTITATTGVIYKVNGVTKVAGTYNIPAGQTVTVTAEPASSAYYFPSGTTTSWGPWTGSTPEACPGPVTPTNIEQPTRACGVADTYTIPSVTGVVYKVNGTVTAAGTYDLPAGQEITITAEAAEGRELSEGATTSWGPFTGQTIVPCPITPTAPTHQVVTTCGATDTYTIPSQTGVLYKVNDVDKAAGTYSLGAGETITVTAHAVSPYTFTEGATTSWGPSTGSVIETCGGGGSVDPTPADPTNPRVIQECGETDQYRIPSREGVIYRVDGVDTAAGTYDLPEDETVNITAHAAPGYQIPSTETVAWSFTGEAVEDCPVPEEPVVEEPVVEEPVAEPAVVETPPAPAPAPAAAPVLAFTGLETAELLLTALFLLGSGIALLLASRRQLTMLG